MKRNFILFALVATSICLVVGRTLGGDKEAPLTGTWNCESKGNPDGDTPFTLYLQQDGEDVNGSVTSTMGDAPLSYGTFKQETLEIHIDTPEGNYILIAKLDDRKLTGTWTYGKAQGTWKAEKKWPANQ